MKGSIDNNDGDKDNNTIRNRKTEEWIKVD